MSDTLVKSRILEVKLQFLETESNINHELHRGILVYASSLDDGTPVSFYAEPGDSVNLMGRDKTRIFMHALEDAARRNHNLAVANSGKISPLGPNWSMDSFKPEAVENQLRGLRVIYDERSRPICGESLRPYSIVLPGGFSSNTLELLIDEVTKNGSGFDGAGVLTPQLFLMPKDFELFVLGKEIMPDEPGYKEGVLTLDIGIAKALNKAYAMQKNANIIVATGTGLAPGLSKIRSFFQYDPHTKKYHCPQNRDEKIILVYGESDPAKFFCYHKEFIELEKEFKGQFVYLPTTSGVKEGDKLDVMGYPVSVGYTESFFSFREAQTRYARIGERDKAELEKLTQHNLEVVSERKERGYEALQKKGQGHLIFPVEKALGRLLNPNTDVITFCGNGATAENLSSLIKPLGFKEKESYFKESW